MFLANTLYLKKVERIMALLMVMTVCLWVYAALEHRIRKTLKQRTRPNGPGFARSLPCARSRSKGQANEPTDRSMGI